VICGHPKYSEDDVREWRRLRREESLSYVAIARMVGAHSSTVRGAITGETWGHLTD
jgi:hypothetical protein